ncbi:MAG: DNA polymerase III subunit beta [Actinomycetota bacterium]|nr:DNA polymerase III subunit beta [Actinomycetota bacterium]
MKFRCERDSLVETLTTAGRAASSRGGTTMALGGIHVSVVGNALTATGTDRDLTIAADTEVVGINDGAVVAPARLLVDVVRSLEPGAVTIESDDDLVEVTASRSHFNLRTFPLDEFPPLDEPSRPSTSLPAHALLDAIRQVVRAASTDDARPLLTGVLITSEGEGIRLVATDSYRLAFCDLPTSNPVLGAAHLLVPARALAELQRVPGISQLVERDEPVTPEGDVDGSPAREGTSGIGVSFGDHDLTFTAGPVRITTRLLDGTYPEYNQLIPPTYPNRLHVGKDSLLDALRRVRLLVRDNTTPVRLSMRQGGVDLTVVSQEIGDASETVDADFDGSDLTVAFNPAYLIDGVEAVPGDEVVVLTTDASKPATVRAAEEARFQYLLMPVRVS